MRKSVINFLFPTYCLHTHQEGDYLTAAGKKQLIPHPEICHITQKESKDFITTSQDSPLRWLIIAFDYNNYCKRLILRLKYHHQYAVADFFAQRLQRLLQTNESLQQDIQSWSTWLTHIPSHRRRHYITKWYNQSQLLADRISKQSGINHISLLRTHRRHRAQTKRNRYQRRQNLFNAFTKHDTKQVKNTDTIIIVDDITTTGSTLINAARILHKSYPQSKIRGIVVARKHKK